MVTRDDEKKNVAKHARNAWFANESIIATMRPNTAPLVLTPFRFKPYDIKRIGTSVENSHRVGEIVALSNKMQKV